MSISLALAVDSPIANLDELKEWLAEEVDRDLADISTRLDKCIQMAESHFNRHLRTPDMEFTITFSVEDEDRPLPSDYLAMRAIYREASPDTPLRGMSPTALKSEFDGTTGTPQAYALVAGGIRVAPPPAEEELFTMDYWARIEPLSVVAPSNWILEKHADLYVTAALFHYYRWSQNRQAALDMKALRDELTAEVNKATRSDRYGAGALVPNATRQVRGARC